MEGLYILDENKKPVELIIESAADLQKWADFMNSDASIVGQEQQGTIFYSATFTGIDRTKGKGKLLLFETMVSSKRDTLIAVKKHATFEEALKLHTKSVTLGKMLDMLREE